MSESIIIAETSKGSIAPVTAELVSAAIALGTSPTVIVPCTDATIAALEFAAAKMFALTEIAASPDIATVCIALPE